MEIRLLGPFEVRTDDRAVAVTGRFRSVLTVMALAAPDPVSVEAIGARVWGDDPPRPCPAQRADTGGLPRDPDRILQLFQRSAAIAQIAVAAAKKDRRQIAVASPRPTTSRADPAASARAITAAMFSRSRSKGRVVVRLAPAATVAR